MLVFLDILLGIFLSVMFIYSFSGVSLTMSVDGAILDEFSNISLNQRGVILDDQMEQLFGDVEAIGRTLSRLDSALEGYQDQRCGLQYAVDVLRSAWRNLELESPEADLIKARHADYFARLSGILKSGVQKSYAGQSKNFGQRIKPEGYTASCGY